MTTTAATTSSDELFFESLDRLLSSSSSSTSSSSSPDHHHHHHNHHILHPLPTSPLFFLSEPSSVHNRRLHLLRLLRLDDHPLFSHSPNPTSIPRSRSDGYVDPSSSPNLGLTKPPLVSRPKSSGAIDQQLSDTCLIKNLDNGEEFVVKETGEDGTCGQLREVATGRNITREQFDMSTGCSPIVQELMRRMDVDEGSSSVDPGNFNSGGGGGGGGGRAKRRANWLRSIRNVAGSMVGGGSYYRERRSGDERDTSSEKGGRRSSSATDDSQDGCHGVYSCPARVKVRQYGKSHKELSGLCMSQEIQAHNGPIWSIKFSLDGRYLASAGEDCVIHVWEVVETDRKGDFGNDKDENGNRNPFSLGITNCSPEPVPVVLASTVGNHSEKKRRAKLTGGQRSLSSDPLAVPERMFALSEKPVCSFRGHLIDVLDLCWSESQYLLSSSMDKTVRLWHMSSPSCLKIFSHSDYVTCIQFNPVDDRYFISGSLDEKVRIWSIPNRQIVDWTDLHEMVTAACYTPDGQGALVGSIKGNCHVYDTSDNKLLEKRQTDLENKKSKCKKITGFQFSPRSTSKVLITSADSRIRVVDGDELVHKFKGFRNTSSQISAYFTPNGKHVICASEDSHVYFWKYDDDDYQPNKSRCGASTTQSYEYFHCQGVTAAIPWPKTSMDEIRRSNSSKLNGLNGSQPNSPPAHKTNEHKHYPSSVHPSNVSQLHCPALPASDRFSERVSSTWPEELMNGTSSTQTKGNHLVGSMAATTPSRSSWGLVIVTAGRSGEIRAFQNFGSPIRV